MSESKTEQRERLIELSEKIKSTASKLQMLSVFLHSPDYAVALVECAVENLRLSVETMSAVGNEKPYEESTGTAKPAEVAPGETLVVDRNDVKSLQDLQERMKKGWVRFSYTKKNGETREAVGTNRIDLIPESKHPKGEITMEKIIYGHMSTEQKYFDADANDWRAFVKANLLVSPGDVDVQQDKDDFFSDI